MVFDPCQHHITQLVLKAGTLIRQLKGLSEEKNITHLYNETAPLLGIAINQMSSKDADHLPSPSEMKKPDGTFLVPRKDCPKCGREQNMIFGPLCRGCEDAEGGKYKTMWFCGEMDGTRQLIPGTGCGFKQRSEKYFIETLDELKVEIPNGMKQSLGIKTFTDDGFK